MAAVLFLSTTFVQAPARTVEGPQRQLRVLETASMSTGLAMAGSLPAFATWGEGSESGQNIDPDSTEYYNRKVLNATAICLTFAVFLFGLVVSQAGRVVFYTYLFAVVAVLQWQSILEFRALGAPVPLQLLVLFCIGFSGFLVLWLLSLTTVKETGTVLLRILAFVTVSFVLMVYTDDLWPG
ncbi:unnamed protein product [Durusdinium trenchii]|uniref:Uncharacterized protein n=1 Tax=Durusdinium trenchii TaxID=1381693 RepID=A0ABP0P6H1_9DINO